MDSQQRPRPGQPKLERFLRDEVAKRHGSISRFLQQASYPNASFYRVMADSPSATPEQARRLESALELPQGLIDYIVEGEPETMGEPFDRAMWTIYLRAMTDAQRQRMVARLEDEFAREFGTGQEERRNGQAL